MSEFVFRTDAEKGMPAILREVLTLRGWLEYDESLPPDEQRPFNLFWRTNRFTSSEIYSASYPYARVNHCPKSSELTKKDHLYRHLRRMRVVHGSCYDYLPTTFALPGEYVKFCQYYVAERDKWDALQTQAAVDPTVSVDRDPPTYICKPSELSRGRKIFVFRDIAQLTYDCSSVVQKYIDRPLLIHGHKVDFRVYVLVTCFRPLRVYIYDDFLARFSADKYDPADLDNIFSHLTNYSVNKNNPRFDEPKEGIGTGCKWHGAQTRAFFAELGVDWAVLWTRVESLVCYTLLSTLGMVPQVPQSFELYGFDVLFDEDFKPWLVEVNFSPALAIESETDDIVKRALMSDMIDTLNIQPFPSPSTSEEITDQNNRTPSMQPPGNMDRRKRAPDAGTALSRRREGTANATSPESSGPSSDKARPNSLHHIRRDGITGQRSRSCAGHTAASRHQSSSSTFIDSPKGNFRWCFPFSAETEKLNQQLGDPNAVADQVLRRCIAEVKKRDAQAATKMKSFAEQYSNAMGGSRPAVASKRTGSGVPRAAAAAPRGSSVARSSMQQDKPRAPTPSSQPDTDVAAMFAALRDEARGMKF